MELQQPQLSEQARHSAHRLILTVRSAQNPDEVENRVHSAGKAPPWAGPSLPPTLYLLEGTVSCHFLGRASAPADWEGPESVLL